jgi:hypothetical protein
MLADNYETVAVRSLEDTDNPLVHDVSQGGAILGAFSFYQIDSCKWHAKLLLGTETPRRQHRAVKFQYGDCRLTVMPGKLVCKARGGVPRVN